MPDSVTFEEAIAITQSLLAQMEANELPQADVSDAIAKLVKTTNGARGFFVTYLTSEGTLADNPSPAVIQALQSSPDTVAELLVKNLAMSAAMAVTHRRNDNEEMAQGSDRVRSRTANLMEQVQLTQVRELSEQLRDSTVTGEGTYKTFLNRWGYDAEQRQVMREALEQTIPRIQ
jgi:hypothetical protein